jgi:membrane-bound serine protease (ClpP class)
MRRGFWVSLAILSAILWASPTLAAAPRVVVLNLDGVIGPATSDYVHRGLGQAQKQGATLVILRMDTPGGLDTAMRRIIQDILSSPIPVATYVAPSGARAASAGTYILYASHIAAMAPGTNVGAATPVQLGGPPSPEAPGGDGKPATPKDDAMTHKMVNDAVAYIRSLAQLRGRNAEWAEKAVREAASLPAREATKEGVADLMADDLDQLLARLEGREVTLAGHVVRLHTQGATIDRVEPDWRTRLLSVITDPNVAYILMLLGIYGLFFELWNPGYVLPGVVGGISLLLALFAFQVLPVNYAGLALIALGMAFMVAEAFLPSFGALGLGGLVAFVVGSVMLMDTDAQGYAVSWPLIATLALLSLGFFLTVVSLALRARRRPVVSGREQLIGSIGEAMAAFTGTGWIRVHSEDWQARSDTHVRRGQRVRVVGIEGLTLIVQPEPESETEKS